VRGSHAQPPPDPLPAAGPAGDAWTVTIDESTPRRAVLTDAPAVTRERRLRCAGHEAAFCGGPWLAMCLEFAQPPVLARDPAALLAKFNVEAVARGGLGDCAKVPFLVLAVIKLKLLEEGAVATLADPTGVIEGEISQVRSSLARSLLAAHLRGSRRRA
jgi:hypothetical protein